MMRNVNYVLKIGSNPNLHENVKSILELKCTLDDIKLTLDELYTKGANTYEKLVAFVDRMEFIDHLGYVKNEANRNKFKFDGKEVNGVKIRKNYGIAITKFQNYRNK